MHRRRLFGPPTIVSLILLISLGACSSAPQLSDQEMAKIHPLVQQLIKGEKPARLVEGSSVRADGALEYPLLVRMTKPEELDSIGIKPQSKLDRTLTVRVTPEEIIRIARLPSVTSIEPGSTNYPQEQH